MLGFFLVLASLLLAPVCAYLFWKRLEKTGQNTKKYWRYGPVIAALTSLIVLMGLGYGSFDHLDDEVKVWVPWYFLYCLAAVSFRAISRRKVRSLALLLAGLPMLSVTVVTVLACFFLIVIEGLERADPPFHTQRMSADIECRAWHLGWAGNDSGYNLKLFQQSLKGGIEHEMAHSSYIASNASQNDPGTLSNCDELYAQYLRQQQTQSNSR